MTPDDVPAGPLLLDTDVFSFLTWRRGRHEEFAALVDGHPFVLSFATVGELRAGAVKANWGEGRRNTLETRISECLILGATDPVAKWYGELHGRFRDSLKKDGSNDMWTLACALAQAPHVPIATNNRTDFEMMAVVFPIFIVHPDL